MYREQCDPTLDQADALRLKLSAADQSKLDLAVTSALAAIATAVKQLTPVSNRMTLVRVDVTKSNLKTSDFSGLLTTTPFTVEAVISGTDPIDRVLFEIDGAVQGTGEKSPPLCLYGDNNGVYNTKLLAEGQHTVKATLYVGGSSVEVKYVNFTVAKPPVVDPTPASTGTQPSKANTGTKGTLTIASSGFQPESGKTYQNLIIKNDLDLRNVSNVTFINCLIDAVGGNYCLRCDGSGTNRVFKGCELTNVGSAFIYGSNFTCTGCYCHKSDGDGFKPGDNTLIQGCYITDLGRAPGAHADGVQVRGSTNIRIIGNFFDQGRDLKCNRNLFVQADSSGKGTSNLVYDGNWNSGHGDFAIQVFDSTKPNTIKITNNWFYKNTFTDNKYKPQYTQSGVVWTGNKMMDGTLV